MNFLRRLSFLFILFFLPISGATAQNLYTMPDNIHTRWTSFENIEGAKGAGGKENKGAKGHPSERIPAGKTVTLLDAQGPGIIKRTWLTVSDRSPKMLRSLRISMYWDDETKPAVSAPLGDFFGVGLGQRLSFENVLFADPEGRSFNCFIPMPFKEGAKVTITNESDQDLEALFFDVNLVKVDQLKDDVLYFHAFWNRDINTTLSKDYKILPKIKGKGRFLGTNIGVITDSIYQDTWWGEGEVKMYLDGDDSLSTLVGTGAEDYIGTAWGQGTFDHKYQGALIADKEKRQYAFYRYHIPDPVYFYENIRVTIQQMGGAPRQKVIELQKNGAELSPVTVATDSGLVKLLDMKKTPSLQDPEFPKGWTNFYRSDDWSSTAYFYLDKPVSNLPELPPVKLRIKKISN